MFHIIPPSPRPTPDWGPHPLSQGHGPWCFGCQHKQSHVVASVKDPPLPLHLPLNFSFWEWWGGGTGCIFLYNKETFGL